MANRDDIVAVLDQNFTQVFSLAQMIRASVKESSRPMEHPIETGSVITDHRIVMPVEINLAILVESVNVKNVYNQIKQLYVDGTFLIVQTRSANYLNQFIVALPHEETAEQSGVIVIGLRLKEAQVVRSQSTKAVIQPTDPSNETTVDSGIKEPVVQDSPSALASFFNTGA